MPSTVSTCSASPRRSSSPWPPRRATTTPSTCSRWATPSLARGWYHDRQKPPDSLHSTVSAGNAPVIEQYLADLAECVTEVGGTRLTDRSTSYATLE